MNKPSEIFSAALSLDYGKQIVLTFQDRKKFLSMRTGLHTAKRATGDNTIKIKSMNESTITLQRYEEDEFSMETIDAPEEEVETKREEILIHSLPQKGISKDILKVLSSLESTKAMLTQELRDRISILGPEQSQLDRLNPESELFALESEFNTIQKKIRSFKSSTGIPPTRFPTWESSNEESLIEPD